MKLLIYTPLQRPTHSPRNKHPPPLPTLIHFYVLETKVHQIQEQKAHPIYEKTQKQTSNLNGTSTSHQAPVIPPTNSKQKFIITPIRPDPAQNSGNNNEKLHNYDQQPPRNNQNKQGLISARNRYNGLPVTNRKSSLNKVAPRTQPPTRTRNNTTDGKNSLYNHTHIPTYYIHTYIQISSLIIYNLLYNFI